MRAKTPAWQHQLHMLLLNEAHGTVLHTKNIDARRMRMHAPNRGRHGSKDRRAKHYQPLSKSNVLLRMGIHLCVFKDLFIYVSQYAFSLISNPTILEP